MPSMMPAYWIGISQPANSTIFAPRASWRSSMGWAAGAGLGHGRPLASLRTSRRSRRRQRATSARSVSKVSSEDASPNAPADLGELVVVPCEVTAGRHHEVVVDVLWIASAGHDQY
jgi:hypothetical protein